MSEDLFLTHEQLKSMTGASTKRRQIENLRANNVPFTINAAGWPRVYKGWLDGETRQKPQARAWVPRVLAQVSNGA